MQSNDSDKTTKSVAKSVLNKYRVCAAPKINEDNIRKLNQDNEGKQLDLRRINSLPYYPEYSELKAAQLREQEELRSEGKVIKKNTLTGFVEDTHVSFPQFEEQRRKFESSITSPNTSNEPNREVQTTDQEVTEDKQEHEKNEEPSSISHKALKRLKNDDPFDIDGYLGPWAPKEGERHVSRPNPEEMAILAEYSAKKKKRPNPVGEGEAEAPPQEKAQLHIKDPYDYQGRSFLQAPRDLDGIKLYDETSPEGCSIPRNLAHSYRGHTKPITAIRLFPKTAHLVLSSSLDSKVRLWEIYKERRCIMTYSGHKQGIKDVCFNSDGDRFVTASYDRYMKLWDTETGRCIQRFTNNKMAYCVRFNPDPECSHLFLTGMSNKKILCWDCRSGEIVQEYDRHLGAVNSITFVDENRRFVSTSDDKSIRVWEWDIPVDVKYIADPSLHSMPAVTSSPNNKKLLCQSMDNKIQGFICHNKFKLDNSKIFRGHMVAGYACVPDFSCDMSIVTSGDADGRIFFWSWSTTKMITNFKAHDGVCISVIWHPHERQKLISAGWDNLVKVWD